MHARSAKPGLTRNWMGFATLALCLLLSACTGGGSTDAADTTAPVGSDAKLPPVDTAKITIDYSCDTDDQCVIKDIGSCCGYRPACVNVDSPTDPAGVKAACERDGTMSICGFPAINACQCVANRCEGIGEQEAAMPASGDK